MIEIRTGAAVWSDHYDSKRSRMFAFESEAAARFARAIDLELIAQRSRHGPLNTPPLDIAQLVTCGYACLHRPRSASNLAAARALFKQALRIDDRDAEALAGFAQSHISDVMGRWSRGPAVQLRLAEEAAGRAIEVNPRLASAYHVRGLVLVVQRQYERATAAFDTAVQLQPSLAPAHAELGFMSGRMRGGDGLCHALDAFARARRMSPSEAVLANWLYGLGVAHLKIGEHERAVRWLNESIGINPLPAAFAYLASAHALLGNVVQARDTLSEFSRLQPRETLRTFGNRVLADHQIFPGSPIFRGLQKAGLRER